MSPALAAENVSVTLGRNEILRSVSLSAEAGQVISLVGPNGAGKSTLFGVLSGDHAPTSGQALIDGRPLGDFSLKELARTRAVLPQDHLVRFSYSVEEIVGLARLSHQTSPEEDEQIVSQAISDVELAGMRRRDVQTLSGGEMGRAAFARVLAQTTPIVLLDEPTAALDLRHQESLLTRVRQLREHGACVITVLHDLNLAAAYSDRVIVLADGQIRADGTPAEVFSAELISEVYRQRVLVTEHPTRGCPLVLATD
ncbi:heme ABC transporter ATP-binding protein [Brevibacterium otitidis]|uniref:Heme ABC transporter ATP-binding protein n=1 Tax=Brevibacterium otitidis TaxID=53364 RepID=A0ABV5X715_9MICO|nr:heme ABC transporter ATP-binding protein [Brevibacterium otitidis]